MVIDVGVCRAGEVSEIQWSVIDLTAILGRQKTFFFPFNLDS